MTSSAHRDDIDWLRAVAVLSVCFFHWHVPPFRGGYVGVDVFFVISGFLITRIIQSEVRQGTFSFAQFYERRVRRLLPALYLMIALTVLASFFFLLPSERSELFKSVIATATFTSNIFFWQQSGYFDGAADEKLLLHTWSLSVEEQFYLALPFIIWLLARIQARRLSQLPLLALVLSGLALASFAYGYWLIATGQTTTAFFLSPPRAWEFLLGSLVAIEGLPRLRNIHLQRSGRILGLTLILIAVFGYRAATPFPGVNALLPCLGAAIYLWSGISGPAVSRWRWSPVHVANFFGKISYSLYLWHWPLVIYARFLKTDLILTSTDVLTVAITAVALSYASYRFIEQPIRRKTFIRNRGPVMRFAAVATAAMILTSVAGILTPAQSNDETVRSLQVYENYDHGAMYDIGHCFITDPPFNTTECLRMQPAKANILLWGDSVTVQYLHGLRSYLDGSKTNIMLATSGGCFASLEADISYGAACLSISQGVNNLVRHNKPDLVIIGGLWSLYVRPMGFEKTIENLQRTIAYLRGRGIPVVIIGPPVQYRAKLPAMILRAHLRGIVPTADEIQNPDMFALDEMMKARFSSQEGVTYFSVLDALCPHRQCPVRLENGALMSWDKHHLTADGSLLAGRYLSPAVKTILRKAPE